MIRKFIDLIKIINIFVIFGYASYFINDYYNIDSVYNSEISINANGRYSNQVILQIPRINLKQKVVKADFNFSNLDKNLVYYKDFNINNKVIIFGHSGSGYGTFFNRINELEKDNNIIISYQDNIYEYMFKNKYFIHDNNINILNEEENSRSLLLITCDKYNDNKRLVVEYVLKSAKNVRK